MNIYRAFTASAVFVAAVAMPGAAMADTSQTITGSSSTATINGVNFGVSSPSGESSNGGSSAVTATRPDTLLGAGDTGSLELHGDRTRYVIGNLYGGTSQPGFALSSLRSFTFDWNNDSVTASQLHAAPVARVIVADNNGVRAELIWEHVYNGGVSGIATPQDSWFSAGENNVWYANVRSGTPSPLAAFQTNSQFDTTGFTTEGGSGAGVVYNASGSQINQTLTAWSQYFSADAKVIGFSFGAGSGFGAGYTGFVDNAAITTASGTDRLNFEASVAAVPEPATWAMMLVGFGMVAGAARRRRAKATAVA